MPDDITDSDGNGPSDYLVVGHPMKPSTWSLQVKVKGKPDHRLMGAAWAALHGGYRGNKYEGPDKAAALAKLIALYKSEGMDTPEVTMSFSADLGQPVSEQPVPPAAPGDFPLITRRVKVFEVGDFPDKYFELSEQEADEAIRDFRPVPLRMTHRRTPLEGKLGSLQKMWRTGKDLLGEVAIPSWLDAVLGKDGKLSAEWDRATKRLDAVAFVDSPRVTDAALIAAFEEATDAQKAKALRDWLKAEGIETDLLESSDLLDLLGETVATFAGRFDTPAGQAAIQKIHDDAAMGGAKCRASKAAFASQHEMNAFQQIHDIASTHGARCGPVGAGEEDANGTTPSGTATYSKTPRGGVAVSRVLDWINGKRKEENLEPVSEEDLRAEFSADAKAAIDAERKAREDDKKRYDDELERLRKADAERVKFEAQMAHERVQLRAATFAHDAVSSRRLPPGLEADMALLAERILTSDATVTFDETKGEKPTATLLAEMLAKFPTTDLYLSERVQSDPKLAALFAREETPDPKKAGTKPEDIDALLEMTPMGQQALARRNGNGK